VRLSIARWPKIGECRGIEPQSKAALHGYDCFAGDEGLE
jgi:hypothetical protein